MPARKSTPTPASTRAGKFGAAARKALAATEADAEPGDEAARTLLLIVSGALDGAARSGNPYAVAALAGRALEALRELRLTPASRGPSTDASPLAALLDKLSEPQVCHRTEY
jgi:hypothetical protein